VTVDLPEYRLKTNALQRRLGDYLISEGKLSPDQLDEAIEYQCIYGGRLGTSLIELGLINEEQLAQILSQQLKLHYIKPDLLMNVPNDILNLVPKNLALKYQVVPYHKERGKLFLAMNDASNLADIDELSFQLDHVIIPLAIPEIRLMLALKKHYGMDLTPRFENLEAQIQRRSKTDLNLPKGKNIKTPTQEDSAWPMLGDEDYAGEEANDDAYFGFGTSTVELSLTSLSQQLAAATDRNDIARAIINYLSQEFTASGLLMVRSTNVTGWLSSCSIDDPAGFDQFSIPLQDHSIFNMVVKSKSHYLGTVADTPQNCMLLDFFQTKPPQTALVLPMLVRDRLVSILYIQDGMDNLEKRFSELQNIARKAEMALTLLILKNKILTT
jgi:hypothetical protein